MVEPAQSASPQSRGHELSNAMVALHRELFGRGPAEARSAISGSLAVCMMSDVYTPVERRLIEAGRGEAVMDLRLSHQRLCEARIIEVAAATLGRPVLAVLSSFHVEPDIAVEAFVLGRRQDAPGSGAGD
jgi:uncharacterized protein YbcI